ncbi:MAG TPA: hypothetical protein DHV12_05070 [Thermotogae bacterium]|nr:hypothetical protein [Thermotogota bacterium]
MIVKIRIFLLLFLFAISMGFPFSAGLSLSNFDGLEVTVDTGEVELGLGYPSFKLDVDVDVLDIYSFEFVGAVNLQSPATDAYSVLSFGGDFGWIESGVGAGVELIEPEVIATDLTEEGRFFLRGILVFKLGHVRFGLTWDRYIYSMIRTVDGYVFNYFKVNRTPLSDNRVTFMISLEFPFDRGLLELGMGYTFDAGWIRSLDQMVYDINDFLISLRISRRF